MNKERVWQTDGAPTVYGYKNPNSNSFFLSLFLRAGSMHGDESVPGITHFLEHITIRNIDKVMGGTLYSTLDRLGLEFNASTYSEMVQFYISGASKRLPDAIDIILKAFSPIKLSAEEIKREGERIKAEIREGDERSSLANFTSRIVYEGTALEGSITGSAGAISRITGKRLEEYRRSVFTRDNIFFYLTGAYDDADIDSLCNGLKQLSLPQGNFHDNIARVPKGFFNRTPEVKIKGADYTVLRFTFDMDMKKCSMPACDILYDILLSGYNSRLYIELSEKRGLCYDVSGAMERYKNIGTFTFSVELKGRDIYEALEIILGVLNEMKNMPFSEDRLMKAGYVDNAYMLYDDPRELNFTFAYDNHIMNEGYTSLDERRERYSAVTPEMVRACAMEIFKKENLTLTMKGVRRTTDAKKINEMLSGF
jgi:predicted Zn-dependent peptidase